MGSLTQFVFQFQGTATDAVPPNRSALFTNLGKAFPGEAPETALEATPGEATGVRGPASALPAVSFPKISNLDLVRLLSRRGLF